MGTYRMLDLTPKGRAEESFPTRCSGCAITTATTRMQLARRASAAGGNIEGAAMGNTLFSNTGDGCAIRGDAAGPPAASLLSLAAAPTFVAMALWSAVAGGPAEMMCSSGGSAVSLNGMGAMYALTWGDRSTASHRRPRPLEGPQTILLDGPFTPGLGRLLLDRSTWQPRVSATTRGCDLMGSR